MAAGEQRALLDLPRVVVRAVHGRRIVHQVEQRAVVQRLDLLVGPVVAHDALLAFAAACVASSRRAV